MATVNIQEVGTGKTHATLKAFATWLQSRDLVANDEIVEAHVFTNQTPTDVNPCVLKPATFNAQCYCVVRPAPTLGFQDTDPTGALDYGSTGIEIVCNVGSNFRISHGVIMKGFRITVNDGGSTTLAINMAPSSLSGITTNVVNPTLTQCKILNNHASASMSAIYTGELASPCNVTDCVFVGSNIAKLVNLGMNSRLERNTFVKRGTGVGTAAVTTTQYGTYTLRDDLFLDCGSTPVIRNSEGTISNCFSNTSITGTSTGFTVNTTAGALVEDVASDLRPKSAGPLIGAASSNAASIPDVRGNNRGATPDVGSLQLTPAAALPTCTITSMTVAGQTVTISGTTSETPTSGLATLSASTTPNGAVTQGPSSVTLGTGTFSIEWTNVPAGNYDSPTVTVSNSGGTSSPATGGSPVTILGISGSIQVPDGDPPASLPTVSISSTTITGQRVSVAGTVDLAGDAAGSLNAYLDPQPSGSSIGPFSVTPSGGNWSSVLTVPTAGDWKVRAVVSANSQQVSATGSITVTAVNASGTILLPI